MSIAQANQIRDLEQHVKALTTLVEQLAREIDELKARPEPRRGRPPKDANEQQ